MSALLPRWICSGYKVAGRRHACGRVVRQGDPGAATISMMCSDCRREWEKAYPVARVRSEKATARRIARGYGPAESDDVAFNGFERGD